MKGERRHLFAAATLFLVDAWVYGQGVLSLLVLLFTGAVLLPLWLSAQDEEELARRRGFRALVYGFFAACSILVAALNVRSASNTAWNVASACRRFHTQRGAYPESLAQLVPEYFPAIPKARWTLLYADFTYSPAPGDHRLMWTALPPFGRRWIRIEDGRSGILD